MDPLYHFGEQLYQACPAYYAKCKILAVIGGLVSLLLIPILLVGLVNEFVLVYIFLHVSSLQPYQRILNLACVALDTLYLIHNGLIMVVLPKGVPWLMLHSIQLENVGHLECKTVNYVGALLNTARINLLVLESLTYFMSISATKTREISISVMTSAIGSCLIIGTIFAAVIPITYQLWIVNGLFICSADPSWAKRLVFFVDLHQALLCNGGLQAIAILLINIGTVKKYHRLRHALRCITSVHREKTVLSNTLGGLRTRIFGLCVNVKHTLWRTTLVAIMRIGKVLYFIGIHTIIYNPTSTTESMEKRITLVFLKSLLDITDGVEMLLITSHLGLCYLHVPEVRNWCLMCVGCLFGQNSHILNIVAKGELKMPQQTIMTPEESSFDTGYYRTLLEVAHGLPSEHVKYATRWLTGQKNLPAELQKLRRKLQTQTQEGN